MSRDEIGGVMRNLDEICLTHTGDSGTREIEKLGEQPRQSVRLALNQLGQRSGVVVRGRHLRQQFGGTSDRSQRILDLVREGSAQLGDGFESLGAGVKTLDI